MVQGAALISQEPITFQPRFLQTMREISGEHNNTTFLPVPIDLPAPFLKGAMKTQPPIGRGVPPLGAMRDKI